MPKVKVHNYSCKGLEPIHGKVNVNVNAGGTFSAKLPEPVAKMFGQDRVSGNELDKVIREFDKLLKEFSEAKTSVEKVIVCKFEANAYVYRPTEEYPDGQCLFTRDDISFCEGTALCLYVQVYDKFTTKSPDGDLIRYEHVESSIPDGSKWKSKFDEYHSKGYHVMPWTEEREAFFANIMRVMEDMIMKLDEVFKTKEGLTALVDAGGFNLLGNGDHE